MHKLDGSKNLINDKLIFCLIKIRLSEIRKEIPNINFRDICNYIENVILKLNKIRLLNDLAYFILNIKINVLIEFLNISAVLDSENSIEENFKSIIEG